MAIGFPVSLSNFFDMGAVVETTFWLPQVGEGEEVASGEIYQVQSTPRLWEGSVTFAADTHDAMDAIAVRANLLLSPGASFYVTPRHRRRPIADVGGGLGTIVLNAVSANNRDITLGGLPSGYPLKTGSYLGFSYDGKSAFHQIVNGGVATTGASPGIVTVEVLPALRPGFSIGTPIAVVGPLCRAVMKAGSFRPVRHVSGFSYGCAFDWRQTLAQ